MSFFQTSVLNKYLAVQPQKQIDEAYAKYVEYFHNIEIQKNIRAAKEEQFQEGFLRELFVKVLGYTLNPEPDYNLTTELKNEKNAKKCDGAILKGGNAVAVIELKGTDTTDLDKVNDQAFNYKNNQTGCVYVITSNFEKLRFFIHNAVEHIEFNLFKLDRQEFGLFWHCLSSDSVISGLPEKTWKESVVAEKNITKQLYKDYANFKNDIWRNISQNNSNSEDLFLYKKSQKLLDRFLFILFSEDRGLLPPNTITLEIERWRKLEDLDAYKPLYDVFKQYFTYIDKGKKGSNSSEDIYAYNGGLFAYDKTLEGLSIDDSILLEHLLVLTKYDFNSEIDVNILGHIFENSLTQFEYIRASLDGIVLDTTQTKRKKDGVFYTPKYVTKYVIDSSIGLICISKKNELGVDEEDYLKDKKGRRKKTLADLKSKLDQYREWLLQLTVCDPACGSGAFLSQALEFLINEHNYIDELESKLFGHGFVFKDIADHILEKNIYGVDINEESIEIAKLSLWLRTAENGRKLTTLSNNIKCGNSLISQQSDTCSNPFDWKKEFPEVFKDGGFDIIVGNPPYVGEKGNSDLFEAIKSIPKWKDYYRRRSNTYYFFVKQGIDLLKESGIQSLIIPREFTTADWANKVRKEILTKSIILEIVDFNDLSVFEDAGTTSLILTQMKNKQSGSKKYTFPLKSIADPDTIEVDLYNNIINKDVSISEIDLTGTLPWSFYQAKLKESENIIPLGEIYKVSQGLVTGADRTTKRHVSNNLVEPGLIGRGVFILEEGKDIKHRDNLISLKINDEWVDLQDREKAFIKSFVKAENLNKWYVSESPYYIIYVGSNNLEGSVRDYLMQFSGILINRSTTINEGEVITLDEFERFSIDDIKEKYSSAGAVQKIMRRKRWWLPLYERLDIPFSEPNIIVNTKNMNDFTYSDAEFLSSGGGAGGQNFIYLDNDANYLADIEKYSNKKDFVVFTTAVLNSSILQQHIINGKYNQLSTAKISELPIIKINFENIDEKEIYDKVLNYIKIITSTHKHLCKKKRKFIKLLQYSEGINSTNRKINEWYKLEFDDFVRELNSIKKDSSLQKLNKRQVFEWLDLFEEQKNEVQLLECEIKTTEDTINDKLSKLYN